MSIYRKMYKITQTIRVDIILKFTAHNPQKETYNAKNSCIIPEKLTRFCEGGAKGRKKGVRMSEQNFLERLS